MREGAAAGALLMVLASACWASMSGIIRHVAVDVHPLEVAFFRTAFGVLFMLPWIVRARGVRMPRRDMPMFLLRAGLHSVAVWCWFVAVTLMPLAEAVALYFTAPFFATILAVLILSEKVDRARWLAVAVGFAGAMMVLRPGVEAFRLAALLVLGCAVFSAGQRITVRFLTERADPNAIVTIHFLIMTPIMLVPALFVWTWPDATSLGWMAAIAAISTIGHAAITRAYAMAEASQLAPYDFTQLVVAALIGYVVFSEVPDPWAWAGGLVIVGSAVAIARRESLRRQAAARLA